MVHSSKQGIEKIIKFPYVSNCHTAQKDGPGFHHLCASREHGKAAPRADQEEVRLVSQTAWRNNARGQMNDPSASPA